MLNRRRMLQLGAGALALRGVASTANEATTIEGNLPLIQRPIPSSGELLPVIGMGTSRTFDTGSDADSLHKLTQLMTAFVNGQGAVIDSSPMYGEAESRVGDVLQLLPERPRIFAATKVWTTGEARGIAQMEESARRMNVTTFDLIAVHNLTDWKTQLKTLHHWKQQGKVRYIGITTSHGRSHRELLEVMRSQALDFVQFSYNIEDRTAEEELLPLAADRGIATMINRPFQRGSLFSRSRASALPAVARDLDCHSWGQFYLKFILGNPAVTAVIPATSKLDHMVDNMKANFGRLPDRLQRDEMLRVFQDL